MQNIDQEVPDDQLADDMQFRDSRFHGGRTMVAVKDGKDVCWNCHALLLGKDHGDVPVGTAWIRICTRPRCSAHIEEEMRGLRTHQSPSLRNIKKISQKMHKRSRR